MNISTILDMAAEAFGERVAVVCGDRAYTYAELRERALAAAQVIRASAAAHVALLDVNSPVAPAALFAAAYAGVPYVPLNYRLTADELNALVGRVTPTMLVIGSEFRNTIKSSGDVQVIERDALLVLPPATEAAMPQDDPRAIAVQLFTSGTTGTPKAAILRHENLMSYILGTVEFAAADENDAIIVTVPPYHVAGISAVLSSTYACRRMVQMENFEAAAWLETCRRHAVSNAFLVPTMLSRIVEHLDATGASADLPKLRALAYGGGKMPLAIIRRAMQLLPQVDFTNAYGLTETSSTIAVLGPDDHRMAAASDDPRVQRRLGSVGRAAAVEIQIRDEAGGVLEPEQTGMVYVRGPQVSGEYQSQEGSGGNSGGSQLDAEGWFPTRDRGYLDAEGYLFLDGRDDDVIVRGGENISPGEIEDVLMTHPAVADVACVAIPDAQWGEAVAAVVVLRDGASVTPAELQALVKQQLRSSRVPQAIRFRDALPYNELGKLLRRLLRQELAEPASAVTT